MSFRAKVVRRHHFDALPYHRLRRSSESCNVIRAVSHSPVSRLDQVQPTSHLLDDSVPSESTDEQGVEHESTPIINEYDLPSGGSDLRFVNI